MNKVNSRGYTKKNTGIRHREGNVVDFRIDYIEKIAKIYKLEVKQINETTVQIINNKTRSVWFAYNYSSYIRLQHKNQGSDNIHSHHQRDFYDIEFMCRSISSHDIYKSASQDYRNSGIGRLFGMIESGNMKQKYIKIS